MLRQGRREAFQGLLGGLIAAFFIGLIILAVNVAVGHVRFNGDDIARIAALPGFLFVVFIVRSYVLSRSDLRWVAVAGQIYELDRGIVVLLAEDRDHAGLFTETLHEDSLSAVHAEGTSRLWLTRSGTRYVLAQASAEPLVCIVRPVADWQPELAQLLADGRPPAEATVGEFDSGTVDER